MLAAVPPALAALRESERSPAGDAQVQGRAGQRVRSRPRPHPDRAADRELQRGPGTHDRQVLLDGLLPSPLLHRPQRRPPSSTRPRDAPRLQRDLLLPFAERRASSATTIPVVPVEVLAGPQGEPAVPHFFREFVDRPPDAHDLTLPGHYSVNVRIELLTFKASSADGGLQRLRSAPGHDRGERGSRLGHARGSPSSRAHPRVRRSRPAGPPRSSITGDRRRSRPMGSQASAVTITLAGCERRPDAGRDARISPATGSSNTLGTCSATQRLGVSTCSLRSTTAEVKTLGDRDAGSPRPAGR